jgi:hypothetical protein
VPIECGPILAPEFEERLLNDITGLLFAPHDSPRVPQQVPLILEKDTLHPLGLDRVTVIHPGLASMSAPAL